MCLINLCRNCSRGCALSIPLPRPGCSWGVGWKPVLGNLCSVCALLGGVGGGDSWGWSGAAAAASCGCVTVCVCCLNYFHFESASVAGPVKDTNDGRWDDVPTFVFSCAPRDTNVSNVFALAPSLLSTHRGFTWLNCLG